MAAVILQVLLLPIHLTLSWLFLSVRLGAPRSSWRGFDWSAVVMAFFAWFATAFWANSLDVRAGDIWATVYATAGSYMAFNAVLWPAWIYRWARTRRSTSL